MAIPYGIRQPPFGIRTRLSRDNGQSWSKEIVVRDDGGGWDLSYCRTVQRPDRRIVTVCYFNDTNHQERYIGATIWDPGR